MGSLQRQLEAAGALHSLTRMDGWVRWLFGGINGGGVIGACIGIPIGASLWIVDVDAIRPAFYEAIAAAIPVLLLAVLLLVRGEGKAMDQLEEPRRGRRIETETILDEIHRQTVEVSEIRERSPSESSERERAERLLERLHESESRLHRLLDRFAKRASVMPVLFILYVCFAVGAAGEIAALAALGSGASTMATYLLTVLGVGGLLVLMVIMERNAITRASEYRRIEDELENEFAAQKERQAA